MKSTIKNLNFAKMSENMYYLNSSHQEGLPYFGGTNLSSHPGSYGVESAPFQSSSYDANIMSSPFGQEVSAAKKDLPEKKKKRKNKKGKTTSIPEPLNELPKAQNPSIENKENDESEEETTNKVSKALWKKNLKRLLLKQGKLLDETNKVPSKRGPGGKEGTCQKGDNCLYAHSNSELRIQPNLKKTKMCHSFQIGKCHSGSSCSFAHSEDELRSTPDFYKTSLCHNFAKGTCRLGNRCRYAHGEEELRNGQSFFGSNNNGSIFKIDQYVKPNTYAENPESDGSEDEEKDIMSTQQNNQMMNNYYFPQSSLGSSTFAGNNMQMNTYYSQNTQQTFGNNTQYSLQPNPSLQVQQNNNPLDQFNPLSDELIMSMFKQK